MVEESHSKDNTVMLYQATQTMERTESPEIYPHI